MAKQPPLAGRNDPRLQERYEQLLEAAAAEFATRGYHQTTVKDIVERAGVATGTFYLYFANKEQSCIALIERLYGRVLAEVVAARAGMATTLDKLAASIRAALGVFGAHRNLAHIALVRAPGAHPLFDELLARIHRELWDLVAEDIREAVEEGLLPDQPADIAARALIGALYEVVISWLQAEVPADLAEAVEPLVGFCLRGLGATWPGA
ncbi:TetR/AcrR family transcriptional regulator [Thermaerobacter sp. PB12/4term]|uniref:TetR/AcrR family transcriptional regulator n=1 Tax=Thermaerobacter sp. PB12/4term TaxID=2293838 RepID=UPI000E3254C6|nr:TetR/AcrR family transcriptional regulator [Thermaerobacter sp. PB12/4term]QIA27322.1 TetR/AcrR family transcriptional regulator [Thermaerobacter sp. PB12/4term]